MEANNITVIYTEQGGSSKMAETIAKETNAEILTLHTLESLSKKNEKRKRGLSFYYGGKFKSTFL